MASASVQKGHKKNVKFHTKSVPKNTLERTMFRFNILLKICRKGKPALILKSVLNNDLVMGWFEITCYVEEKLTTVTNLV